MKKLMLQVYMAPVRCGWRAADWVDDNSAGISRWFDCLFMTGNVSLLYEVKYDAVARRQMSAEQIARAERRAVIVAVLWLIALLAGVGACVRGWLK